VCRELSEALGREQAAQRLLSQQGEQIRELTARVEANATDLEAARRAMQEAEQVRQGSPSLSAAFFLSLVSSLMCEVDRASWS